MITKEHLLTAAHKNRQYFRDLLRSLPDHSFLQEKIPDAIDSIFQYNKSAVDDYNLFVSALGLNLPELSTICHYMLSNYVRYITAMELYDWIKNACKRLTEYSRMEKRQIGVGINLSYIKKSNVLWSLIALGFLPEDTIIVSYDDSFSASASANIDVLWFDDVMYSGGQMSRTIREFKSINPPNIGVYAVVYAYHHHENAEIVHPAVKASVTRNSKKCYTVSRAIEEIVAVFADSDESRTLLIDILNRISRFKNQVYTAEHTTFTYLQTKMPDYISVSPLLYNYNTILIAGCNEVKSCPPPVYKEWLTTILESYL